MDRNKILKIFFWIGIFIILVGIAGLFGEWENPFAFLQRVLCLCFGFTWLMVVGILWFVNKQKNHPIKME